MISIRFLPPLRGFLDPILAISARIVLAARPACEPASSPLALVIALGGTSAFAATQLAKNSFGSKQLKKNAIYKDQLGNVLLRGFASFGTPGQAVFQLPPGYRPGRLHAGTEGAVYVSGTTNNLEGVSFRAEG